MPERIQTVRQLKEWLKAFSDQDSVWRDPGPATRQRGHVPPRGSADDHRSATARTAILGRGRKRGNEGGRARAHTIVVLSVVLLMGACGDDDAITSFSLMKVDPKESFGHEWLPLNPTVYKIHSNTVVSNTIGFMSRYDNCSVFAIDNWECSYADGSGRFGFRDGEYWTEPINVEIRHVSRLEYYLVRCEWNLKDSSFILGAIACVGGWLAGA